MVGLQFMPSAWKARLAALFSADGHNRPCDRGRRLVSCCWIWRWRRRVQLPPGNLFKSGKFMRFLKILILTYEN